MIAQALRHPAKDPLARIGRYLDAAAAAGAALEKGPEDPRAREDYNFAVARIFEVTHEAGLEPWNAPLRCQGDLEMKKMPNSIDFLNPENRFVNNLAALPLAKGIPFHTILGDRGKGAT